MKKTAITIVGAGLVGSLLATLLAQRGFAVSVFERRSDPRRAGFLGGRSINLALAERGWHGLRLAGLQQRMQPIAVMMRGRMIHDLDGQTNLQRYGRDDSEVIWSVNRGSLNTTLLDAAEEAGASLHFDQRLDSVDWTTSTLNMRSENDVAHAHHAGIILGCDGAGSALRAAMAEVIDLGERFEPLGHGYKELEIPALADFSVDQLPPPLRDALARGERFAMEPNALHIWPRGNYMCIALPNAEGSFTVTLFLPNEGVPSLASLTTADQVRAFFERDFADAVPLMPDFVKDFFGNPTGLLGTLYLDRWQFDGKALLLGDASHAIVPFHGQGMNSGFEDAVELAELLEATPNDSAQVFAEFERRRKPNADAIAAMALENYIEMRDRVDDADYLLMRELDRALASRHPGRWVPRYSMVTFSRIPYATALERGEIQTQLLREFIKGKQRLADIDLDAVDVLVRQRLQPVAASG
ncbi:MAG: NAD(P)/FAD-dependent oxidoreductase [Dokdonella sp.]